MASISVEQFDKQLQEQKDAFNADKWRDLTEDQIYTIISIEFINTQYGEACILNLGDKRVYAPSSLIKRLKQETQKPFPRYVRPKGLTQSKKNSAHTYHAFDLV